MSTKEMEVAGGKHPTPSWGGWAVVLDWCSWKKAFGGSLKISVCLTLMARTAEIRQPLSVIVHFSVTSIFPWVYLLHLFFQWCQKLLQALHIPCWTMLPSQPLTPAQQNRPKQIFSPSGPTLWFSICPNAIRAYSKSRTDLMKVRCFLNLSGLL